MAKKTEPAPRRTRRYDSSRRRLQAQRTRDDVLRAASELFATTGWAGTTLAAIAERAGVAVETVYKGFGSKKRLLLEAMDAAVVGDAEPVPLFDRPEFASLLEGDLEQRLARAVELIAQIHARSAGVWQAVVEASRSDEEVDAWRRDAERRRRLDLGRATERVLGRPPDDQLLTALSILYGPEAYLKLVVDEGRTQDDYEAFLRDTSRRLGVDGPAG